MKQTLPGALALSFALLAFRMPVSEIASPTHHISSPFPASIAGASILATAPLPDPLTEEDRKYAVDYYLKTKQRLLDDVNGLSPAQLSWKADSTRWSIYQCTEHIALSESFIFGLIQQGIKQPANPAKRSEVKYTSDQLIAMMTDRSHKAEAPAPVRPGTQFPDEKAALKAYTNRRDSTIEYIRTTQDDLKDHFAPHPVFGTIDLYQALIILAAHSARHTLQIEEVKASPGFPKM